MRLFSRKQVPAISAHDEQIASLRGLAAQLTDERDALYDYALESDDYTDVCATFALQQEDEIERLIAYPATLRQALQDAQRPNIRLSKELAVVTQERDDAWAKLEQITVPVPTATPQASQTPTTPESEQSPVQKNGKKSPASRRRATGTVDVVVTSEATCAVCDKPASARNRCPGCRAFFCDAHYHAHLKDNAQFITSLGVNGHSCEREESEGSHA